MLISFYSEDITSDVFSICLDILYVVFKVQISQNLLIFSKPYEKWR